LGKSALKQVLQGAYVHDFPATAVDYAAHIFASTLLSYSAAAREVSLAKSPGKP
jgi:hypothetical protein